MTTFEKRHVNYYIPLIQEFLRDVESLPRLEINGMPEPHLPLFGKSYETSALKLVIVGQDTKWWFDLLEFIAAEKANPGSTMIKRLNWFRERPKGGGPRQHFQGFTMMMLAALHGQKDWGNSG